MHKATLIKNHWIRRQNNFYFQHTKKRRRTSVVARNRREKRIKSGMSDRKKLKESEMIKKGCGNQLGKDAMSPLNVKKELYGRG